MKISKCDAAFTTIAVVHVIAAVSQAAARNWIAVGLAVMVAAAAAAVPLRHRDWRQVDSQGD